jgi:hypothetical protein
MKLHDVFPHDKGNNMKRARNIAARAKMRARKNKQDDGHMPTGWRADPHQSSHNGINWR